MKKLISILVVVAMLLATVVAIIPTSAATKEEAAVATYNVNWKALIDAGTMESQWYSEIRNDYDSKFTVTATETQIASEKIGKGDVRAYYSLNMFDITETTYYEYVFEAKNNDNNHGGYAGVIFAFNYQPGTKSYMPYFMYGAFQNDSDDGKKADFRLQFGHQDGGDKWIDAREYPVVKPIDDDGNGNHFGRYKVVFDGFDVNFYYYDANDQFVEMFADKTCTLPETAKVCLGVYSRDGTNDGLDRNVVLRNAVLTAWNAESAAIVNEVALEISVDVAEAATAEGGYTPTTAGALATALAAANTALTTEGADLVAAKTALDNAIAGLKKAGDKTALEALIATAGNVLGDSEGYDATLWSTYENALVSANEVIEDVEAVQSDVDGEYDNLYAALLALEPKFALIDAMKSYDALDEALYTPASWEAVATAYEAATTASESTTATPADIKKAADDLNKAIVELKLLANFDKLQAVYDEALLLDEVDFVDTSWNLDTALTEAKTVLENQNATQEAVDTALTNLNNALAALESKKVNVMGGSNADTQFAGQGNVFYYDYHKYIVAKGYTAGQTFEMSGDDKGDSNFMLRLGNNSGSGTASVCDGVKDSGSFSHYRGDIEINGTNYGHAFGYSFANSVTVDEVKFYIPTDTKIASIDVYGAVIGDDGAGNKLYGKDADKVFLGSFDVPDAIEGEKYISVRGKFVEALKVDYIFFAVTFDAETSGNYKFYEIELFGLKDGAADFSALKTAYAAYNALSEIDYTEATWAALEAVVAETDLVNKNALSTATEIADAATELTGAIEALEVKAADKTALEAAITAATAVEAEYTPNSWAPYAEALAAATAAKENATIAQSAVNAATAALTDAQAALVKKADKTALKTALDDAKALKADDWKGNTLAWNLFADEITDAQTLYDDDNATQAAVDDMVASLATKKASLQATPGGDSDETEAPTGDGETEAPTGGDETEAPTGGDETETPTGDDETETPTGDDETETPAGDETETPAGDDETETPADDDEDGDKTDAPATEAPEEEDDGCGSSIALSALAVVGVIGTAVVLKKKED